MADAVSQTGVGLAAWRSYNSWRNVQQAQVRDITADMNYHGSQIRTASAVLVNAIAQSKAAEAVATTRGDIHSTSYYNSLYNKDATVISTGNSGSFNLNMIV